VSAAGFPPVLDGHGEMELAPSPSADEAAAIVAALERFRRATAAGTGAGAEELPVAGWMRAALLEGVERGQEEDARDPWINT